MKNNFCFVNSPLINCISVMKMEHCNKFNIYPTRYISLTRMDLFSDPLMLSMGLIIAINQCQWQSNSNFRVFIVHVKITVWCITSTYLSFQPIICISLPIMLFAIFISYVHLICYIWSCITKLSCITKWFTSILSNHISQCHSLMFIKSHVHQHG